MVCRKPYANIRGIHRVEALEASVGIPVVSNNLPLLVNSSLSSFRATSISKMLVLDVVEHQFDTNAISINIVV